MSLRSRVAEAVKPLVREHAPQCLVDLWGREQVMVAIPTLEFSHSGKNYLAAEGKIRVQFISERPDMLPSESLWEAIAEITIPPVKNEFTDSLLKTYYRD